MTLFEVQPIFQPETRRQITRIESQQFPRLVVAELRREQGKACRNRPVGQVRLGETKYVLRLPCSSFQRDRHRFSEAHEIVR